MRERLPIYVERGAYLRTKGLLHVLYRNDALRRNSDCLVIVYDAIRLPLQASFAA